MHVIIFKKATDATIRYLDSNTAGGPVRQDFHATVVEHGSDHSWRVAPKQESGVGHNPSITERFGRFDRIWCDGLKNNARVFFAFLSCVGKLSIAGLAIPNWCHLRLIRFIFSRDPSFFPFFTVPHPAVDDGTQDKQACRCPKCDFECFSPQAVLVNEVEYENQK